jgi:hypothetical protein
MQWFPSCLVLSPITNWQGESWGTHSHLLKYCHLCTAITVPAYTWISGIHELHATNLAWPVRHSDGLKWRLEGRSHARQCLLTRGLLPMLSAPGPSGDQVGLCTWICSVWLFASHCVRRRSNIYYVILWYQPNRWYITFWFWRQLGAYINNCSLPT